MTTPPKKPGDKPISTGTDKINAASELRWFFNRLRSTMVIADDLEKIGSMENALAEGENNLKSLRQQQEDEKRKLSALEADVDAAKNEAIQIIDQAGKRAKEMDEAAKRDADKAKYAGQMKVDEMLTNAAKRSKMMDTDIAAKRETLDKLNDEVTKAQAKLAEVNKQLDAVRRKVTA